MTIEESNRMIFDTREEMYLSLGKRITVTKKTGETVIGNNSFVGHAAPEDELLPPDYCMIVRHDDTHSFCIRDYEIKSIEVIA